MQYQPMISRDENGTETPIAIPVMRNEVIERINKGLANDRQRLFLDGDRVVWIDLRNAQEIDNARLDRLRDGRDVTLLRHGD